MADGFLEKHYEDYEARKAAWLQKKKHLSKKKKEILSAPKTRRSNLSSENLEFGEFQ